MPSTYTLRFAMAALVLLVLAFAAAGENIDSPNAHGSSRHRTPTRYKLRSIHQACRAEIRRLCSDKKQVITCITTAVDSIEDVTCKTWVTARSACIEDVRAKGLCGANELGQVCVRKADRAALSPECTNTDYYRSLRPFGNVVRRTPRGHSEKQ